LRPVSAFYRKRIAGIRIGKSVRTKDAVALIFGGQDYFAGAGTNRLACTLIVREPEELVLPEGSSNRIPKLVASQL